MIDQEKMTSAVDVVAQDIHNSEATRKRKLRAKKISIKKRKLSHHHPVTCSDYEEVSRSKKTSENEFDPEVMKEWSGLNVPLPVLKALAQFEFYSPMPIQKQVVYFLLFNTIRAVHFEEIYILFKIKQMLNVLVTLQL